MERLFFLLQSEKQFDRQVRILTYLDMIQTSVSSTELARVVGCTTPTLRGDIKAINLNFPKELKIIAHTDSDGYKLASPKGISIFSYLMEIAQNTIVFQIIDNILHNRILSFQQAIDELYLSKSVLRKTINHMNTVLKSFNISISTINIDFIGDESDIRYFLYVFYADFRDYFVVNNKLDAQDETYGEILNTSKNFNYPRIHLGYFRSTIWIMILAERLLHKHYVSLDMELIKEIQDRDSFKEHTKFFGAALSKVFGLASLPLEEHIWSYIVALHCISYTDPDRTLKDNDTTEYVYRREESEEVIKQVDTFLELELCSTLMNQKQIEKIRSYLINLRLLSKLTPQFERVSFPLSNFMKESLNGFYNKWRLQLEQNDTKLLYPIQYKKDVAVTLSMLHFSMLDSLHIRDVNVLFSFQGESGYDEFLVQTTRLLVTENIHASYIFEKSITLNMIQELKADLVVCNYDPPGVQDSPVRIVRLSYIPSAVEWTVLRDILVELSKL